VASRAKCLRQREIMNRHAVRRPPDRWSRSERVQTRALEAPDLAMMLPNMVALRGAKLAVMVFPPSMITVVEGLVGSATPPVQFTNPILDLEWPQRRPRNSDTRNYATAHHWYAEYLAVMGRFEEAEVEIKHARQLGSAVTDCGYGPRGDPVLRPGVRPCDRGIPEGTGDGAAFSTDRHDLSWYLKTGMFKEVLADLETEQGSKNESPWYWAELAYREGQVGRTAEARRAMKKLREMNRRNRLIRWRWPLRAWGLNEGSEAMDWLDKSYAAHSYPLFP